MIQLKVSETITEKTYLQITIMVTFLGFQTISTIKLSINLMKSIPQF